MMTSGYTAQRILRRFLCTCENNKSNYIRILGIESSCDDSSAAVVDSNRKILGFGHFSQAAIHVLNGGILPNLAGHIHKQKLKEIINEALEKSQLEPKDLDAIAVTVKPGLFPSLRAGLSYAKDLCTLYGKPLIPIHHMEAHALTVRLMEDIKFPFLVLLISGGHCILAIAESATKFSVLGETTDLAPGTLLDKVARRLKLNNLKRFRYTQGGPAIAALAANGDPFAVNFSVNDTSVFTMSNFAFSGLYMPIMKYISAAEKEKDIMGEKLLPNIEDICASVQYLIGKHICTKVEMGMRYLTGNNKFNHEEKVLAVSGGVACNTFFQSMLQIVCNKYEFKLVVPPSYLCTDNGIMIAWNGIERLQANVEPVDVRNIHNVDCEAECKLGETIPNIKQQITKGNFIQFHSILKTQKETDAMNTS